MAFTHNNMLVNLLGPDLNFSRTTTTLHGNNQSPTWQFSAPVSLPHGATITQVRARITDTNNDVNLNVKLRSVSLLNEAVTNHANFSSSGSAGEARTFTDSSISSPVVDNENLAYSVELRWLLGITDDEESIQLHSVRISYTIDSPLP